MEISQFSYKNHNAIIRCKTVPFYFARHFPLEYLHGIDSRINDMDSATLNNKKNDVFARHAKCFTDFFWDCDLSFGHNFYHCIICNSQRKSNAIHVMDLFGT